MYTQDFLLDFIIKVNSSYLYTNNNIVARIA